MKAALLPLLLFALPLRAAELDPARIPNSARWHFHADLDAMRSSGSGKTLFALMEKEHGKKLKAFERMFSLHPLQDLRDITLFGDGKADHAVALIHGRFDPAHLVDVVGAADDYRTGQHAGVTIHHWSDKGVGQHAAFAKPELLVFSRQEPLLREALDLLAARAPAAREPRPDPDGRPPLIAASARIAEIDLPGEGARLIRMAKAFRLSLHEHDGRFLVRMEAETAEARDADRLRRMIDGLVAFAQASHPPLGDLDLECRLESDPARPGMSGRLSVPLAQWLPLLEEAGALRTGK